LKIKKFAANWVWVKPGQILKNGIVAFDENNTVVDVIDTGGNLREISGLEFHNGVLVPGFVNAHSHLELAHMKNLIAQGGGLIHFLGEVSKLRRNRLFSEKESRKAIEEMWQSGTVAVGDISNTNHTLEIKSKYKGMYFHTFVELISIRNTDLDNKLQEGEQLSEQFRAKILNGDASVCPHAPYTCTSLALSKIAELAEKQKAIISIHNQETEAENTFSQSKSGDFVDFFNYLGISIENMSENGQNSLPAVLSIMNQSNNILLVHNVFTSADDLQQVSHRFHQLYFVLCPLSNLYISNRLPDVYLLRKFGVHIAIGTDSLASNLRQSVFEELKAIRIHFADIPVDELIAWATINGAKALGIDSWAGTFEIGKRPGLNLIQNFDFVDQNITDKSTIKRFF